jgi:hypothetical protein
MFFVRRALKVVKKQIREAPKRVNDADFKPQLIKDQLSAFRYVST